MITIQAIKYTSNGKQSIELGLSDILDLIPTATENEPFIAENKDGTIIQAGEPCALCPSGTGIIKAKASSANFWAFGLALAPIEVTFAGVIQTNSQIYLPNWTNITGLVNLVARAVYYLAPNGGLTVDPPTTPGCILQQIGIVTAPNTLDIKIGQPILL